MAISDECYDEIVFEAEHVSAAKFDEDDRVISVFSCSKTYSMTCWRLGYTLAPKQLSLFNGKASDRGTSSISSTTQKAAEAALGPQTLQAQRRTGKAENVPDMIRRACPLRATGCILLHAGYLTADLRCWRRSLSAWYPSRKSQLRRARPLARGSGFGAAFACDYSRETPDWLEPPLEAIAT